MYEINTFTTSNFTNRPRSFIAPYQYLVEGELWEVDVVSANNGGYGFAVGEYHAHGAEEVLQIMKREANKA
jgi:hypothetical protein